MISSTPKQNLASFISDRIAEIGITPEAIREVLAFEQLATVNNMLSGQTRFPIKFIPALATVLKLDPTHLLRVALSEYSPETLATIDAVAFGGSLLTNNEKALIKSYRDVVGLEDKGAVVACARDVIAVVMV